MFLRKHRWLSVAIIMAVGAVAVFILIEPFLSLPPIWEEASVGVVLISFGALMMLGGTIEGYLREVQFSQKWPFARFRHALPPTVDELRERLN